MPSCPFCWDQKHKCPRDPVTLECRDCRSFNQQGQNQRQAVPYADHFYDACAHAELYRGLTKNYAPTIGTTIGSEDFNTFSVQVTTSTARTSRRHLFRIDGLFDTRDELIVEELDNVVQEFLTANLHGVDGSVVVGNAVLAGGYIHLLCSTIPLGSGEERVRTKIDGVKHENDYEQYGLHVHFQYLVLCRLRELLHACLDAIRFEDPNEEFPQETLDAFAAAVILRYEVAYFRRSLQYGGLSRIGHLAPGLKTILVEWFASIEDELTIRLRRGCSQFPNWHDAIVGSKKNFRRSWETLTLTLTLHQFKYTICEAQLGAAEYTPIGDGNAWLSSPKLSPGLEALRMSCNTPDEVEQLPSHVSYPLPELFGTWAETSVFGSCDLLSHWQPSIRSSD